MTTETESVTYEARPPLKGQITTYMDTDKNEIREAEAILDRFRFEVIQDKPDYQNFPVEISRKFGRALVLKSGDMDIEIIRFKDEFHIEIHGAYYTMVKP